MKTAITKDTIALLDHFLRPVKTALKAKRTNDAFSIANEHRDALVVFIENVVGQLAQHEFQIDAEALTGIRVQLGAKRHATSWKRKPAYVQELAATVMRVLGDWSLLSKSGGYSANRGIPSALLSKKLPDFLKALSNYVTRRRNKELASRIDRCVSDMEDLFNG